MTPGSLTRELAAAVIGYRLDTHLSASARTVCKTVIAVAVLLFGMATVRAARSDPAPTRGNIQLLQTLETFTKTSAPDAGNTIPAFLASAGQLGRLPAAGTGDDPVLAIDETELRESFCSPSVADLVRHEYPGYYDHWSDERLERSVLQKHPEYGNRYCMLPTRLDAAADEVIKYELTPRSPASWLAICLVALLATSAFAMACLNAYYRLIVHWLVEPDGSPIRS